MQRRRLIVASVGLAVPAGVVAMSGCSLIESGPATPLAAVDDLITGLDTTNEKAVGRVCMDGYVPEELAKFVAEFSGEKVFVQDMQLGATVSGSVYALHVTMNTREGGGTSKFDGKVLQPNYETGFAEKYWRVRIDGLYA